MTTKKKKAYRVLPGQEIDFPPAQYVKKSAGKYVVSADAERKSVQGGKNGSGPLRDIPECSIPWMVEQGYIEEVGSDG